MSAGWSIFPPRGEVVTGKLTPTEQAVLRGMARGMKLCSTPGMAAAGEGSLWALLRAIASGKVKVKSPAPSAAPPCEKVERGCPVERE